MPDNLVQKGGTYHVRLSIPKDVRKHFGNRAVLDRSLHTGLRKDAMTLRLHYLNQWKAQIADARKTKADQADLWRAEIVRGMGVQEAILPAIGARFLAGTIPNPADDLSNHTLSEVKEMWAGDPERLRIRQHCYLIWRHHQNLYEDLKERLSNDADSLSRYRMLTDFLKDTSHLLWANKYDLTQAETIEAASIAASPQTFKEVSLITPNRLAAFRTHRLANLTELKTIDQQESKLTKLSSYLNSEGKPLTHEAVVSWLATLKLSSKTKAQYILAGNTFWKWAIKNDAYWKKNFANSVNPFSGIELPKLRGKAKADNARRAFKKEEIESIYSAAQSEGLQVLSDLILLGSYTGARIEEICKIKANNIITIDGIECFDIQDSKTAAGIRQVPIHPRIQSLVNNLSATTLDGYLIKSSAGNKYNNRSDSLSKAFGRLKTKLGFDRKVVFHSVRAMAITLLSRSGTDFNILANIVGHETGLVTYDIYDIYDDGATASQKLEALKRLSYEFTGPKVNIDITD